MFNSDQIKKKYQWIKDVDQIHLWPIKRYKSKKLNPILGYYVKNMTPKIYYYSTENCGFEPDDERPMALMGATQVLMINLIGSIIHMISNWYWR